jgi:hypothetical protein
MKRIKLSHSVTGFPALVFLKIWDAAGCEEAKSD